MSSREQRPDNADADAEIQSSPEGLKANGASEDLSSSSALRILALTAERDELKKERDHERHEKETVAEAMQGYARWSQAERARLEAKLTALTAERDQAERQCAEEQRLANQEGLRADRAEAQLTVLRQALNLCADHQPDKWEGDGTCVLCEGQRLAVELAVLRQEREKLLIEAALEIGLRESAEQELRATRKAAGCIVEPHISRCCEFGSCGCNVRHTAPATGVREDAT